MRISLKGSILLILLSFSLQFCKIEEDRSINKTTLTKWQLWSEGTKLRGVNIWQKKIDPEVDEDFIGPGSFGPPFTQSDFDRLRALGVNYVNISHPGIYTEAPPYVINDGAVANLKSLVDMIGKADMFVVISFRTGPGRSEYTFYYGEDIQSDPENGWFDQKYYNDTVWEDTEARSAWAEMWKRTAEEFKDNAYVVGYDLMVEPNSSEVFFDIFDPEEFYSKYRGTSYDWNFFFPLIISGIRTVDGNTPIIAGAMSYSEPEWLQYMQIVPDEKTLYSFHQYSPHRYTHQSVSDRIEYPGVLDTDWDGIPDEFDRNWLDGYLDKATQFMNTTGKITAANEYGGVRYAPGMGDFLNDEMSFFESAGINYAIWEWASSFEPFRSEVNDFNFMMGTDPDNRDDIEDNPLLSVLKKYWKKNSLRPSNTNFINN